MDVSFYINNWAEELLNLSPTWLTIWGLYMLCWVVQLFYWLGPLRRLAVYTPDTEPIAPAVPYPVSVVVCCHNNLVGIQALLEALHGQEYPNFEVVVVDDRSNDATYNWLLTESRKPQPRFKLVRVNTRPDHIAGKKYALTLGIKAASHPALLLTDSDCLPTSAHWVSRIAATLQGPQSAVLGYGPLAYRPGLLNMLARYDAFYTGLQYVGFALAGKPYMGVGRNLAYYKDVFLSTKGFAAHAAQAGGDDDLFINKAVHDGFITETNVCLHPDAQMVSAAKTTFSDWFWQKVRHLSAGKRYHATDQRKLGLLQGSHLFLYGLLISMLAVPVLLPLVGVAYLVRLVAVMVVQALAAKRLGERLPVAALPLLDAWLPVQFLVFGLPALLLRKVAWARTDAALVPEMAGEAEVY